jgi:hypothetical protein
LTLAEAYPDRFILGLGVSHRHLVETIRGHKFHQPLQVMRDYLAASYPLHIPPTLGAC